VPRRPLPPSRKNRSPSPPIDTTVAVSSADIRGRRRRLRRRRPFSGRTDDTGDLLVRLRSSWTLPLPLSASERRPSLVTGECPPWPWLPWPLRQRGLSCGPRAPAVSDRGSTDPGYNLLLVFNFRKFQNLVESCKNHRIFSVCQKNMHDLSKCSKK
jgi:hypothetical protein